MNQRLLGPGTTAPIMLRLICKSAAHCLLLQALGAPPAQDLSDSCMCEQAWCVRGSTHGGKVNALALRVRMELGRRQLTQVCQMKIIDPDLPRRPPVRTRCRAHPRALPAPSVTAECERQARSAKQAAPASPGLRKAKKRMHLRLAQGRPAVIRPCLHASQAHPTLITPSPSKKRAQ